jgi:predicted RNA binding protein YcfA (HicA-like mRNA interferase family)
VAELPGVSGREAVRAFGKVDYETDRQRGNHNILRQTDPPHRRLTVPAHKALRKGTLRALIRQSGPLGRGVCCVVVRRLQSG